MKRTWYVHWIPKYERWMVYDFMSCPMGEEVKATAYAATADEGKEIAELAHAEKWNEAHVAESLAFMVVDKLLS